MPGVERHPEGNGGRLIPVPYGQRIAGDCRHLQEHDGERGAMLLMLRMIVEERPFAEVADTLNERGYRTRAGERWSQAAVFQMLPRLIEAAPGIYGSGEWIAMRTRPR